MDTLIIFGAKYLFLLSPLVLGAFFLKAAPEIRKRLAIFACLSLPLAFLLGVGARALYFHPRPFVAENIAPLIEHAPDNGFPSDHVLFLAGLAALLTFFDRRASAPLWLIAALVGLARVFAGIHHLTDIFGSLVIALLSAWIVDTVLHIRNRV